MRYSGRSSVPGTLAVAVRHTLDVVCAAPDTFEVVCWAIVLQRRAVCSISHLCSILCHCFLRCPGTSALLTQLAISSNSFSGIPVLALLQHPVTAEAQVN